MVEAGEAAGILDQVLDRMAFQIERETKLKSRVKGAMMYPMMVLIFATLVLTGMLLFLVPFFVKIFATLGGQLPTLTQYVVKLSDFIKADWWLIGLVSIGGTFGFKRWRRTEHGRRNWDRFKLKLPMKIGRRRSEGDDGALLAHVLDTRRGRRRHHQGARDHRADGRQLGRRGPR